MMFGTYRRLDRQLDICNHDEVDALQSELYDFLADIQDFTARTPLECLQSVNFARHLVEKGDMPESEDRDLLIASLHGLARCIRHDRPDWRRGTAEALRLLPHAGRRAGADGYEALALAAVARGARRFGRGYDAPRGNTRL